MRLLRWPLTVRVFVAGQPTLVHNQHMPGGMLYEMTRQSWHVQAMAVRGEEQEPLNEGHTVDSARKFSGHQIVELDEGGMSELATACKAAGLERLFLTAMKISK